MLIDKNGKIFGKISIVDVAVLLLIVLGGMFFLRQLGIKNKMAAVDRGQLLEVTFYQAEVNDFTAEAVEVGNPAMESHRNVGFGEVVDVEVAESAAVKPGIQGEFVESVKEGYNSITIKTHVQGHLNENDFDLDGEKFYIGDTIMYKVGNAIFYGDISNVELVEE